MGCCCSGPSLDSLDKLRHWRVQFNALQLRESELRRMYKVFRKIDVDGSGNINIAELLAHISVERTPFTERIFSIFDEDASGEIDFREFVLSLWNYCTLTKATLDMFSFDLYDRDGSGELSAREVKKMLKDIYGAEYTTNFHAQNIKNDLKDLEKRGVSIDVEQFRKFCTTHQALLFPAARIQLYLQMKVLGRRFWTKNAKRRIKLSKGKFVPISKLLEMHVNKQLMAATLGEDVYADMEAAAAAKYASAKNLVQSMRAFSTDAADDDRDDPNSPDAIVPLGSLSKSLSRSRSRDKGDKTAVGETDHTWFTISQDTGDGSMDGVAVHDLMGAGYGPNNLKGVDMKAQIALEATGMYSKRKQQLYLADEARVTKEAADAAELKKNIDPTQRELYDSNEQEIALMVEAMQQKTTVISSAGGGSSRPSSRQDSSRMGQPSTRPPSRNRSGVSQGSGAAGWADGLDPIPSENPDGYGRGNHGNYSSNHGHHSSSHKGSGKDSAKSGGGSSHRKLTADQKMQQKQFNPYTEEDFVYDDGEGVDFSEKSKHGGHGKDKHGRSGRVAVDPLAQFGVSNMHSESRHRDFDFPGVPDSSHRSKTGTAGKLEPLSKSAACATSAGRRQSWGTSPAPNDRSSQQGKASLVSASNDASSKQGRSGGGGKAPTKKQQATQIVPLTTDALAKQTQSVKAPDIAERLNQLENRPSTTGGGGDVVGGGGGGGRAGLKPLSAAEKAGRATAKAVVRVQKKAEYDKEHHDALWVDPEKVEKIGRRDVRTGPRMNYGADQQQVLR